jgi:hypothetical protein
VINLSAAQRHKERQVMLRLIDAITARSERDLKDAYNLLSRNIGAHPKAVDQVISQHEQNLIRILRKWGRISASAGTTRMREALKQHKSFKARFERKATEEELDALLLDKVKKNALKKAKSIAADDKARIRRYLLDEENLGEGITDRPGEAVIGRGIRERVEGISVWRAKTIARTEVHSMVMEANNETIAAEAEAVGMTEQTKKVWTAGMDLRVRETHLEADGQKVSLDEKFEVGGYMLSFPGDPSGPAGEVINCRCIMTYDVDDEDWDAAERAVSARRR